jgi:hypothetical protein
LQQASAAAKTKTLPTLITVEPSYFIARVAIAAFDAERPVESIRRMKRYALALIVAAVAFAPVAVQAKPTFEAVVAKDQDSKPTTSFPSDIDQVMVFFQSKGTKAGDKVRIAWIAEDVGEVAPKNYKIDEASFDLDKDDGSGGGKVSRPNNGWPAGKYRADIYDGDALATSVKFTIDAPKKDADDDKEGD